MSHYLDLYMTSEEDGDEGFALDAASELEGLLFDAALYGGEDVTVERGEDATYRFRGTPDALRALAYAYCGCEFVDAMAVAGEMKREEEEEEK